MRTMLLWGSFLVVPLALLLFLQWPLRELVQGGYARQANDAGQILFALYVAVAVAAASRAGIHLTANAKSHPVPMHRVTWRKLATMVCVAPWAAFTLWAGVDTIRLSVLGLEHFSETLNPGFFFIKIALGLLLLLILFDAVTAVLRPESHEA